MSENRVALDAAIGAAREAGELLRTEFHRPGGPRGGGGHAEVDEQAERVIRQKILSAFPAAYLGEETGSASGGDQEHVWLVDPNDGTAAYLKGWRGSAVSIALVRQGIPVLGVVYAFGYPDDNGDLLAWAEGCGPLTRNGKPVAGSLADKDLLDDGDLPAVVFISQSADKSPAANAACVAPARFIAMPRERKLNPARWNAVVEKTPSRPAANMRREFKDVFSAARNALMKAGVPEDQFPPKYVGFTPEDYGNERVARKGLERLRWELDRYEPFALAVYSGHTLQVMGV